MKKVLVTGANGFAGKHLVRELAGKYEVFGLTRPSTPSPEATGKVTYVRCDITSKELGQVLKDIMPDIIVHLAAMTHGWFDRPIQLMETNLMGTMNLYENVNQLNKTTAYKPKILYVSSSEIYGKTTNPHSITEDSPLYPVNHYAVSKLGADRLSFAYKEISGLDIIIARPFTHTGPGQTEGFFVPDMVSQAVKIEKGVADTLFVGNLDSVRDYLDVRDVVKAYRLILESDLPPGETVNVCSGEGVKMKDLLKIILKMSNAKIIIKEDPARMRPSDVPAFVGNNLKLVNATKWRRTITLEETIQATFDYWRKIT